MNKTISIHLDGSVFNLDEAAYADMENYLRALHSHFENHPQGAEIIKNTEHRIAELFHQRLKNKQVILPEDVRYIIARLGAIEVDEVENDESQKSFSEAETDASSQASADITKPRLLRDPMQGVLGGVCLGLAHYFNTEANIVRIIFICLFVFGGSGGILYLVLWMLVPKAQSAADRLRMKGEDITIATIKQNIEQEFDTIRNRFKSADEVSTTGNFAEAAFEKLKRAYLWVANALRFFFGYILIAIAIAFFLCWIFLVLSGGDSITFFDRELELVAVRLPGVLAIVTQKESHATFILISLAVFSFTIILGLLLRALKLLYPKDSISIWLLRFNGFMSLISFISLLVFSGISLMAFKNSAGVIDPLYTLNVAPTDTLVFDGIDDDSPQLRQRLRSGRWTIYFDNGRHALSVSKVAINILPATKSQSYIDLLRTSRGETKNEAANLAQQISVFSKLNGNKVKVNPHFLLRSLTLWRNQKAELVVYLLDGQLVKIDPQLRPSVRNLPDTDSGSDPVFQMRKGVLECITCNVEGGD
jgi:phage shock protein PspC (stress-responsive transcriptional regulator)